MTPVKPLKLTDEVERILAASSKAMDRQAIFKASALAVSVDDISRTLHSLHLNGRADKFKQASGTYLWAAPGRYAPQAPSSMQQPSAQPAVAKNTGRPRSVSKQQPSPEAPPVAQITPPAARRTAPAGCDVYDMLARMNADEFGSYVAHLARYWSLLHVQVIK